jgi:hypothetical protein
LMMKPIIIIEGDNDSPGASLPTSSPLITPKSASAAYSNLLLGLAKV